MHKTLSFLAAAFMTCAYLQGANAKVYEFELSGRSIKFDPGGSFCPLNRESTEQERLLFEWQEKANAGINIMLGFFVPCDELETYRSSDVSDGDTFSSWGILLAPLDGGKLEPLQGYSRPRFLREIAKAL